MCSERWLTWTSEKVQRTSVSEAVLTHKVGNRHPTHSHKASGPQQIAEEGTERRQARGREGLGEDSVFWIRQDCCTHDLTVPVVPAHGLYKVRSVIPAWNSGVCEPPSLWTVNNRSCDRGRVLSGFDSQLVDMIQGWLHIQEYMGSPNWTPWIIKKPKRT